MNRLSANGFHALSSRLPADVGIAIASLGGSAQAFGAWSCGVAWSTIKVPLAVAALRTGVELDAQTITHSDNVAAEELWSQLGDPADAARQVQAVIRETGDISTLVESRRLRPEYTPFGQTRWSLIDQARFAAELATLAGAPRVIDLMGNLCTEHRWGLAAKGCAAKGGWGPGLGEGYLVRQFAIVPVDSGAVGVALAADVPDGGYEAGVEVVDKLADWVLERLTQQ